MVGAVAAEVGPGGADGIGMATESEISSEEMLGDAAEVGVMVPTGPAGEGGGGAPNPPAGGAPSRGCGDRGGRGAAPNDGAGDGVGVSVPAAGGSGVGGGGNEGIPAGATWCPTG